MKDLPTLEWWEKADTKKRLLDNNISWEVDAAKSTDAAGKKRIRLFDLIYSIQ